MEEEPSPCIPLLSLSCGDGLARNAPVSRATNLSTPFFHPVHVPIPLVTICVCFKHTYVSGNQRPRSLATPQHKTRLCASTRPPSSSSQVLSRSSPASASAPEGGLGALNRHTQLAAWKDNAQDKGYFGVRRIFQLELLQRLLMTPGTRPAGAGRAGAAQPVACGRRSFATPQAQAVYEEGAGPRALAARHLPRGALPPAPHFPMPPRCKRSGHCGECSGPHSWEIRARRLSAQPLLATSSSKFRDCESL
jgi:hypothetical protein